jgi:hypothetical protein
MTKEKASMEEIYRLIREVFRIYGKFVHDYSYDLYTKNKTVIHSDDRILFEKLFYISLNKGYGNGEIVTVAMCMDKYHITRTISTSGADFHFVNKEDSTIFFNVEIKSAKNAKKLVKNAKKISNLQPLGRFNRRILFKSVINPLIGCRTLKRPDTKNTSNFNLYALCEAAEHYRDYIEDNIRRIFEVFNLDFKLDGDPNDMLSVFLQTAKLYRNTYDNYKFKQTKEKLLFLKTYAKIYNILQQELNINIFDDTSEDVSSSIFLKLLCDILECKPGNGNYIINFNLGNIFEIDTYKIDLNKLRKLSFDELNQFSGVNSSSIMLSYKNIFHNI